MKNVFPQIKLNGLLGNALHRSAVNRLKTVDYDQLVEPFRLRNEADGAWRCEFWGKIVRSAIYAWKSTQDPDLKKQIDFLQQENLNLLKRNINMRYVLQLEMRSMLLVIY